MTGAPRYSDPGQPGAVHAPLARTRDRKYAHEAAATIAPKLGKIQTAVIGAYRHYGQMSSKTAEALPEFAHYGRSTVQKRISELLGVGILEYVEEADRCPTCGRLVPAGPGSTS